MSKTAHQAASSETTEYDLVIAGAGLAGLSLAYALRQVLPWRIALVESQPEKPSSQTADTSEHYDERVLALSAMTVRILKALDIWPALAEQGYPIRKIHVSDEGNYGKVRLDADQQGVAAEASLDQARLGPASFGQVMAARILGQVLADKAAELDVDWYRPDEIVATQVHSAYRQLTLKSGATLNTKLLVVADGSDSTTSKLLGVQAEVHDYHHVAVIANITTDVEHQGLAVERFTSNGPLALLPMTDNRRSLVWTLPPERAEQVMALSDDEFSAELQQAMGYRNGLIEQVGSRQSYPLKRRLVTQAALPRAVVVGNAAHALHPIAGQGFNLALRDVMELAMQLNQQGADADIGAPSSVQAYQQQRDGDQHGVANATHALALLFSNSNKPLKWARNLGLVAMSHLPAAQQLLVDQAMGVSALSRVVEDWSKAKG
ncbi:2-octaprenyl-6-methoxyphenyl hydroxylase [Neiella sp. HB171785]|uniref:2-octaprenyl-6-methoxyphenyl hydroxylase n=1 Tax=Neiella litorisoli TaxID=2771431 RepID=A0A8J6UFG2_9GAMM|nr:2-octaprenyl-6-methoxyphenyl hydroxylase [Neiella litorisoli]MBD1388756.1 2-octaprenyl-6-methoxyphenyl hydroxylase [Neiella litorisoli]